VADDKICAPMMIRAMHD